MLDKHLDSFKFFFIMLALLACFFMIVCIISSRPLILDIASNDPLFLVFRLLFFLFFLVCLRFASRWRLMLTAHFRLTAGMNYTLQDQLSVVPSGDLLRLVQRSRGRGGDLLTRMN